MASKKYQGWTKDQLIKEIKDRASQGASISVDLRSSNDVLALALETDDVANGSADDEEKEDVENAPHDPFLNQVPLPDEGPSAATQPHEDEWKGAEKYRHNGDGYLYQVIKGSGDGKTHKARVPQQRNGHPGLYWEGDEGEFTANFTRP